MRVMPGDALSHVDISDSALAPGLDLPEPDLWQGDAGVGVRLVLSPRRGTEMRTGEMSTVFDGADPGTSPLSTRCSGTFARQQSRTSNSCRAS